MDVTMPEMDGLEVLRRVRTLQTDRPPYIIMLTAKGAKADVIAGLQAGPMTIWPSLLTSASSAPASRWATA